MIEMYFSAETEKNKIWQEMRKTYGLEEDVQYTVVHSKKPKLYKVTESDSA